MVLDSVLKGRPFFLSDEQITWVNATLSEMSTSEKLHQLFCLVTYSDDEADCRYIGDKIQPGGFMLRTMPAEQCISAVNSMQKYSGIPLLVAANLESGGNGVVREGTSVCRPMQAAATDDVEFARRLGEVCGAEGRAVGVNWAFAPIVDLDLNWHNPITNFRTFGSDAERVARMGTAYIREIQKQGVAACAKHFPGDGCDERDQHVSPSINTLSCTDWDKTYGKVYQSCIDANVMSVMVGHIMQPAYTRFFSPETKDEEMLPASLCKELVTGLLRGKLGFEGLIVTDSSAMAGIALALPREYAVPGTIAAGCDMFLFTKNLEEDLIFMEEGYRKNIITEERLNDAVKRILAFKAALRLPERRKPDPDIAKSILGQQKFKQWERECADRSITLVKEEKGIFPILPQRFPRILFCPLDKKGNCINGASVNEKFLHTLQEAGFHVTVFRPNDVTEGQMQSVQKWKEQYDLVLYSAMIRARYQPVARIDWSSPQGANIPVFCHTIPTVFVSFENPYHLFDVPQVRTYINCYGGSNAILEALMDKFAGKSPFVGKSPVDAFCGRWETRISFGPDIDFSALVPKGSKENLL